MATRFSEAYKEMVDGLASRDFSTEKDWQALVTRARKLAGVTGFDVGEASTVEDLRKRLAKADAKNGGEATLLLDAAGTKGSIGTSVTKELAKRLGALKALRHTYLLKRFGGHKVWCLSIPTSFTDWPHEALKGSVGSAKAKLNDQAERFTLEQRKHISHASQEALKWVHKTMCVTGDMKKKSNFALVARWFADGSTKDAEVVTMGATLNAGFKKIAFRLKSGQLIFTDSVSERGTTENALTEAFVWGDPLDVVYIEEQFFGTSNSLTGLTNWARIVVHELTHREVKTVDHAYEHQGMSPKKITAAKAIENADSWAWFCGDCAGALTEGLIKNAMDR